MTVVRMTYWPKKMLRRCSTQSLMKSVIYCGAVILAASLIMMHFFPQSSNSIFHFHSCERILPAGTDCVNTETQDALDYMANHLIIRYTVLNNVQWENELTDRSYHSRLTLYNSGQRPITTDVAWSIYFSHFMLIRQQLEFDVFLGRVNITHVNADLHQLQPTAVFGTLAPKSKLVIMLYPVFWMVARTDAMPNWYVHADGANPRIIACTRNESLMFVSSFGTHEQWKRKSTDLHNPFTPKERYVRNAESDVLEDNAIRIVPTPLKIGKVRGSLKLDSVNWVIAAPSSLKVEADILSAMTGIRVSQSCSSSEPCITMRVDKLTVPTRFIKHAAEAYHIQMTSNSILVTAGGNAGVFYAVQTLISLIDARLKTMPIIDITDAPRFNYRGLMLDVSRHFFPVKDILSLLDLLSLYKLNKLHLHLTDDQGWRLQIPGIPELTEIGGRRGHDPSEKFSLMPSLGSGPFYNSSGSGYFTVSDYRQILRYAKKLHIEIIPEFDFPGHSYAAIHAMAVRYETHRTKDGKKKVAKVYQLEEAADHSMYHSVQMIKNNALNPCLRSTYLFIRDVMRAVIKMHQDISPLRVFHFGGDEVPEDAHQLSPACQKYNMSVNDIYKTKFVNSIMKMAATHNVSLQAWGDAFYKHDHGKPGIVMKHAKSSRLQLYAQAWRPSDEHASMANTFANNGYKVLLSHASHLYFDHPHEPDPEERGLYWATRFIDTAKVFKYQPWNFYNNLDVDGFGQPYEKDLCSGNKNKSLTVQCIALRRPENFVGMEGCLWMETIRTRSQLDSMLFPRLLAMAERSWHQASWEQLPSNTAYKLKHAEDARDADWLKFATHLGTHELPRLGRLGVQYYLPPPGVRVQDQTIDVNTAFPGMPVQVSEDNGSSWQDWRADMKLKGHLLFATRSFDWKRRSRPVVINIK